MRIRPESRPDHNPIRDLTQAAFDGVEHSSGTEAAIIDRLRDAQALGLSLVGEIDGRIVAHIAFSPVLIGGRDRGWVGLGPVSVSPARQRQGLGQAMIREGLARIAAAGAAGCVVLGDPRYYCRFGFEADPGLIFDGAPAEYFMRLGFTGATPTGHVTYQPAFHA